MIYFYFKIKIIETTSAGLIATMSNVFTFKTLRNPFIRVKSIRENLIRIQVKIECRSRFNPEEGLKPITGEDSYNYLFRVLIYYPGAPDWMAPYEKLIQESDFKDTTGDQTYRFYINEIEIGNLNSSVVYYIKLEHEISMASDEFFSSTHFITSNMIKVSTLEKSSFSRLFIFNKTSILLL